MTATVMGIALLSWSPMSSPSVWRPRRKILESNVINTLITLIRFIQSTVRGSFKRTSQCFTKKGKGKETKKINRTAMRNL